jgi:ribulose-phosphate 3-epimerase
VEARGDHKKLVRQIKKAGLKAGISLKPKTPLSRIMPLLPSLDLVLVMTVEPGFGGQKFMPEMLPRITKLRQLIDKQGLNCALQVDGGINADTIAAASIAGADVFVAGNAVFGEKLPARALKKLRAQLEKKA